MRLTEANRSFFQTLFASLGSVLFKTLFFSPKMAIARLLRKSDYLVMGTILVLGKRPQG